jgi:hypothetical protein
MCVGFSLRPLYCVAIVGSVSRLFIRDWAFGFLKSKYKVYILIIFSHQFNINRNMYNVVYLLSSCPIVYYRW